MTDNDIGRMSWGIYDNVTDLADIWLRSAIRRREFGERELRDLRAAHSKLGFLLSVIEANQPKEVA